jgi:hypothetical protein
MNLCELSHGINRRYAEVSAHRVLRCDGGIVTLLEHCPIAQDPRPL